MVKKWDNRNPIVDLGPKRVGGVINEDNIFEISVPNDSQILHEYVIRCHHTGIPVESVID